MTDKPRTMRIVDASWLIGTRLYPSPGAATTWAPPPPPLNIEIHTSDPLPGENP